MLEIPPDIKKALAKSKAVKAKFEMMPPSHQKEYLGYVLEAKKAETRVRRIEKMIAELEKK
ncbi:MAG: YdeI/OmpD-associated family protein [Chloroflexi bacterium]|nr:YdeI/OmpD-associated family protein [Chloroflexota bacterium]